jgi:hypothetical protein
VKPITSVRVRRVRNRKKQPSARIGYVLYENATIVVIATLKCRNRKTGRMIQVWILRRDVSPIRAVKLGLDAAICFDCPHRQPKGFQGRTCYVNLRSPQAIWKAYRRGRYPYLPIEGYADAFTGKKIRFGAYGEPILIPIPVMEELTRVSDGWTGYTHQWRKSEYQPYRVYLMASCDSPNDRARARGIGWRTFRVRGTYDPMEPGEITCPASDEAGHRTQCARCRLCNGVRYAVDPRKDITLLVHGSGAKNFVSLASLIAA